jgi:gluconate kinase
MERMIVVLMGVSGSGKTGLRKRLAAELNWPFFDGDDFHPAENIRKMAQGFNRPRSLAMAGCLKNLIATLENKGERRAGLLRAQENLSRYFTKCG